MNLEKRIEQLEKKVAELEGQVQGQPEKSKVELKVPEGLTKEKLEWLDSIGAIDISKFIYRVYENGHLYSKEYLESNSLEEIKKDYDLLYLNRGYDNFFCNFSNQRNR